MFACLIFSSCQADRKPISTVKKESISEAIISTAITDDNIKDIDTSEESLNNNEAETRNDTNISNHQVEASLYHLILSGDFSSIEDIDAKENMAYLYNLEMKDDICDWQYLIQDFNSDGIDDLYIKFSETYDSALFTYENEGVKWIYIDTLEANCYMYPLSSGEFVQVYDYWIAPTITVFQLDSQFNWTNSVQYIKSNQEEVIANLNEECGELIDNILENQEYRYFYRSPDDKGAMTEQEWYQYQDYLDNHKYDYFELDES